MFIKPGDQVPVLELNKGIVISRNDASIALADYVAGSRFVRRPDEQLRQIPGLQNTHFLTVHGLMRKGSTARRATWRC